MIIDRKNGQLFLELVSLHIEKFIVGEKDGRYYRKDIQSCCDG